MGHTLRIIRDDITENPRHEQDNLGTFWMYHTRYDFGDKGASSISETRRMAYSPDIIYLPVFMYDHSGITINTTGYSCPWDSGQIGIIFVTKAKIREEYHVKRVTKKLIAKVKQLLVGEIAVLDMYLTGDVYGYILEDEDGGVVDSCWGFYGSDPKENGMMDYIDDDVLNDCTVTYE